MSRRELPRSDYVEDAKKVIFPCGVAVNTVGRQQCDNDRFDGRWMTRIG
jgi:hypothetical protein